MQMTNSPQGEESKGLKKLLVEQLKDMLWAENALTKAIPKMVKKATSQELIDALNEHLEVTQQQVEKVTQAFGLLDESPQAKTCEAMKGLIKEAEDIMGEMEDGNVLDAAIICAAQKVEHYEIGTYGCLAAYAGILGEQEVADLLGQVLVEEKEADESLSQVAYQINWKAAEEEENEEEEEA
jgi:ferritin-like metal-binding protein YciE